MNQIADRQHHARSRRRAGPKAGLFAVLALAIMAAALIAAGSVRADDPFPAPAAPSQGSVRYMLPNLQSGGSIVGDAPPAEAPASLAGQRVTRIHTGPAEARTLAGPPFTEEIGSGRAAGRIARTARMDPGLKPTGIDGMGESELALQSMSLDSVRFDLDFFSNVVSGVHGSGEVAALGAKRFKLAEQPDMEFANYSGIFTADGPIGAVARTTWYGGASVVYQALEPTKYAIMPLIAREVYSHSSLIWMQSFNDPGVEEYIDFWLFDEDGSILMSWSVPFRGTEAQIDDLWFQKVFYHDLPVNSAGGFIGTFHASSEAPFAMMIYGDEPFGVGTYAYAAKAKSEADRVQYLPLVRANYYGDTLITIANADNRPVDVTITYQCHPAVDACAGEVYEQELTIGTRYYANIDLSTRGRGNVPSPDLPRGEQANTGFLGTATIRANGPILANGWEQDLVGDYTVGSASYNAFAEADLGTDFVVPHAFMTPDQYPSFLIPMNPGRNRATVEVAVLNDDNQITNVVRTVMLDYDGGMTFIPVSGEHYGNVRLVVTSSEPIALLVIDGPPYRDRTAYGALQMPNGMNEHFPTAPAPTLTPMTTPVTPGTGTPATPGTPGTPSATPTQYDIVGKSYMPLTLRGYP